MASRTVKCVLVGDGAVGKQCMAVTYTTDTFPEEYVPIVAEVYEKEINLDSQVINLVLWVTAGQEDYDRIRPMAYPNTNVFMLCFSLMSETSMKNVTDKWYPEIRNHDKHVPIVLVGTKLDLRQNTEDVRQLRAKNMTPITTGQGNELAHAIKAKRYFECSSRTRENIKETFEETVRVALNHDSTGRKTKAKCVIL